jgi:DNA polymerase III delta prime subunit
MKVTFRKLNTFLLFAQPAGVGHCEALAELAISAEIESDGF